MKMRIGKDIRLLTLNTRRLQITIHSLTRSTPCILIGHDQSSLCGKLLHKHLWYAIQNIYSDLHSRSIGGSRQSRCNLWILIHNYVNKLNLYFRSTKVQKIRLIK